MRFYLWNGQRQIGFFSSACAVAAVLLLLCQACPAQLLSIEAVGQVESGRLANDQLAFSNRDYRWQKVPEPISGWDYTRLAGGGRARLTVTCEQAASIWLAAAPTQVGQDLTGWERVEGWEFAYSDRDRTRMQVYQRKLAAGERVTVEQRAWAGGLLLAPSLRLNRLEPQLDFSTVPGVVIHHSPASSGRYIGSPGIARLPDGSYLAKLDEFGPGSREDLSGLTRVFRSEDRGESWTEVAVLEDLFWASLFVHRDIAYLLGTTKQYGRITIRRSLDGGLTWSAAQDETSGLISPQGEYHTAPTPVLEHDGRLYKAIEDASLGRNWGERFGAMMISASVEADLLEASNWTRSNVLPREPSWLEGKFTAWLEGNPVATPEGEVVNLLRVQHPQGGWIARTHLSESGRKLTFDPKSDFLRFPGGAKKFTIRRDEPSGGYWTLSNPVLPPHQEMDAGNVRNAVALMFSRDLQTWEPRCLLLYHPDAERHGWQYLDWLIEGEDLIVASRTAWDDGLGGARRAHDANFLTFHRFPRFRQLQPGDSVVGSKLLDQLK
jgi:hypothetical protein